ncbi:helix-turn-helix domain-containing protein [Mesorhizobium sp. CN2-181]|uniref:helix-turn-helix domain-containing protein n=1 Tax=Mesorhizobium yinganensis TaxID=3157707 RepID=UPI0032B8187B
MSTEKLAFSIEEAAQAGGPGRTKIYEAIKTGRLKAHKLGRKTVILRDDYLAFLRALPMMEAA